MEERRREEGRKREGGRRREEGRRRRTEMYEHMKGFTKKQH